MRDTALSQRRRFFILIVEVAILLVASTVAFGTPVPPSGDKGFWFYTGLLGLVLGSRLDTPFFSKPADVILYAAPAAVALALANEWPVWDSGRRVAFVVAMAYCATAVAIGSAAIVTKDSTTSKFRRVSNAARVLGETMGAPRPVYTVLMVFALYAFHADSAREIGVLALAWALTAMLSPLETSVRLIDRLKTIWAERNNCSVVGDVAAHRTPGVVLVRRTESAPIECGDLLATRDLFGAARLLIALDQVGRDEGLLLRTLDADCGAPPEELVSATRGLPERSCVLLDASPAELCANTLVATRRSVVGLVAADTSLERLHFDVVQDGAVQEGRLVHVPINGLPVTYQIVSGLTKEEVVHQKNTNGFVRAQAQKIGVWDGTLRRFAPAAWLPRPNAPVVLKDTSVFQAQPEAIGHFPGTDFPVTLRDSEGQPTGLNALVTHNTAILGILGIGKSCIALELVERMMVGGIKVLCLDLTNQYASELAPYHDATDNATRVAALQQVGLVGKTNVKKNVEEGGSRAGFAAAMRQHLEQFMADAYSGKVLILNPAQFDVWRQDSKPFQDTASMASLTPPEITQIISEAALEVVSTAGMSEKARLCIVYEEAHSLVPEWTSAVGEGDRAASNGTARAILQGRKYGLGCLLITQRTANVTKTILNQCNSVFAMRTFDDTGKEFLANYLGQTYAQVLPTLPERHAVFFGRASQCENPVLMRANDRDAFVAVFRRAQAPGAPDGVIAGQ